MTSMIWRSRRLRPSPGMWAIIHFLLSHSLKGGRSANILAYRQQRSRACAKFLALAKDSLAALPLAAVLGLGQHLDLRRQFDQFGQSRRRQLVPRDIPPGLHPRGELV